MRRSSVLTVVAISILATLLAGAERSAAASTPAPMPCPVASAASSHATAPPASTAPNAAPPQLAVNITSLQLNVGMCARLLVSGGVAPYTVSATLGNVAAAPETSAAFIAQGLRNGYDTLSIADAAGTLVHLPVLIAPDAGVLPASITLQLVARAALAPGFAAGVLDAQLVRESHLQPGARIAATDPRTLPALAAGVPASILLPITLDGQNRWRDVHGIVAVQIQLVDMPPLEPVRLFFSDDPENVRSDQRGVLFRGTLTPQLPVRLFTYSQLESAGQRLYIVLQSKGKSRVQILGDVAGPGFYDDVGHKVAVRYLLARRAQQSYLAPIAGDDPVVLAVGEQTIDPARVVSAIYDLLLVDGDPVDVSVVACSGTDDPLSFAQAAPDATFEDAHFRSGVYALDAEPPIMLSASIGMLFGTPAGGTSVMVGSWAIPPLAGKRYLIGDYGVVRPVKITVTNVSAQSAAVYLYETPSPNGGTTTAFFDGEPAPVELPCLQAPANAPVRYLIRKITVPPGGAPVILTGEYMTEGGSAYPIELGLTATVPLDPPPRGNCSASGQPQ